MLTAASAVAAAAGGSPAQMNIMASGMNCPVDVTVDTYGNVYVADNCDHVIFLVTYLSCECCFNILIDLIELN